MSNPITLRASSLARVEECPASYWLSQGQPSTSSPDADRGTRIHAALAAGSPDGLAPDEEALYEACDDLLTERAGAALPDTSLIEESMELRGDGWIVLGHPDLVGIDGAVAVVVDYKTGNTPVAHAANNLQLLAYALMVAQRFRNVADFRLELIQPMAPGQGSSATFSREDLTAAYYRIDQIVRAVMQARGGRDPQPGNCCQYCPAAPTCPAIHRELAAMDRAEIDAKTWSGLSREERLASYDMACRLVKVCEQVRTLCRLDLEADPDAYHGELALAPGRTIPAITDPAGLFEFLEGEGVERAEMLQAVKVAKTKLEPAAKKAVGLKGKEWTAWWTAALAPYTESSQAKPTLKRRES